MKKAKTAAKRKPTPNKGIEPEWFVFVKDRTNTKLRNQLVEKYLYLAREIADCQLGRLPPVVTADELYSSAYMGLMDAVMKFEPSRGYLFKSYALQRIRGSIYDELRKLDYVPRLDRVQNAEYQAKRCELMSKLGRRPTTQEIEDECDHTTHIVGMCSINDVMPSDNHEREFSAVLHARVGTTIDGLDQAFRFSDAIKNITFTQRIVLDLFYFKANTVSKIAEVLHVSQSRVSQLLMGARRILKREMGVKDANKNAKPCR